MATIEELKEATFGWRFTNEQYRLLDSKSLKSIQINTKERSNAIWFHITQSKEKHIFKLPVIFWENLKQIEVFSIDWDNDNFFQNASPETNPSCLIDKTEKITFFWGANNSVGTSWEVFTNHWNDFCYPDDDTVVIHVEDQNILITYVEERFRFYRLGEVKTKL